MTCVVCGATWPDNTGAHCPQCEYDTSASDARDAARIAQAKRAFRERSTAYAPARRVTWLDKARPWLGLALGFLLFYAWLRACSSAAGR